MRAVFFALDQCQDVSVAQQGAREIDADFVPLREGKDAIALLSKASFCITMRLHGMVLSSLVGIPCIGLPANEEDHKIASFAKLCSQTVLLPDEWNVPTLQDAAERALATSAKTTPLIIDSVADLRKKAKKDLENILSMVYNRR